MCDHLQGVSWESDQELIRCSIAVWIAVSANACYVTVVIVLQVYYGGPFANVNLGKSGALLWDTLSGQLSHRALRSWICLKCSRTRTGELETQSYRLQRSQRHKTVAVYLLEVLRNLWMFQHTLCELFVSGPCDCGDSIFHNPLIQVDRFYYGILAKLLCQGCIVTLGHRCEISEADRADARCPFWYYTSSVRQKGKS